MVSRLDRLHDACMAFLFPPSRTINNGLPIKLISDALSYTDHLHTRIHTRLIGLTAAAVAASRRGKKRTTSCVIRGAMVIRPTFASDTGNSVAGRSPALAGHTKPAVLYPLAFPFVLRVLRKRFQLLLYTTGCRYTANPVAVYQKTLK